MEIGTPAVLGAVVSVPGTRDQRTQIHLCSSVLNDGGHSLRHNESAKAVSAKLRALTGHVPGAAELLDDLDHDLTHAGNHLAGEREGDGVIGHARKLRDVLNDSDPAIAAESAELDKVTRSAEAQRAYDKMTAELTADLLGTSR